MHLSSWRRFAEAWLALRVLWIGSLACTVALAVVAIVEAGNEV